MINTIPEDDQDNKLTSPKQSLKNSPKQETKQSPPKLARLSPLRLAPLVQKIELSRIHTNNLVTPSSQNANSPKAQANVNLNPVNTQQERGYVDQRMVDLKIDSSQVKVSGDAGVVDNKSNTHTHTHTHDHKEHGKEKSSISDPDFYKSQTLQDTSDKVRTVGGRVIPKLSPTMASGVLLLNIFFPGLGTMVVGCYISEKNSESENKNEVCCGWFCIGLLQMIFASCIFGWVWSIIAACSIMSVANDPDYSDDVVVVVKQSN